MGFVKTKQELDAYYSVKQRHFPGSRMLGAMFQTRPEVAERLLPPPLDPADSPGCLLFIAEYPETNLGPGYREAALFLQCKYKDEQGSYCLSMPIHSLESRLYNGRDIFGFPKKMATISLEKGDGVASGKVERHGISFVEVKLELTGTLPNLPPTGPTFLFKAMPRIDLMPGFDGPVLLCRQKTDIEMKSMEIGTPEIKFTHSDADPWAEVEVEKAIMGFYMISDNTMQPGEVLEEVDAQAFLPYYFKMTDFATPNK